MPKDTKTLGNNKARACESLGFVHKKDCARVLTHLQVGNDSSHPRKQQFPLKETSVPTEGNSSFYEKKPQFPALGNCGSCRKKRKFPTDRKLQTSHSYILSQTSLFMKLQPF